MLKGSILRTFSNIPLRAARSATMLAVLKRALPLCAVMLFSFALSGAVARAQSSLPLLDDFTTGSLNKPLVLRSGRVVDYQQCDPNHTIGGFRTTAFAIATNRLNQTATLDIPRGGPLIFNSDIQVFAGLQVVYGQDKHGRGNPLNLNLSGYDRFRLNFDSSDQQLHITVTVYWEGSAKYASYTVDQPESFMPFSVDFPFAAFVSFTPPVDFNDIDVIVWQVTGSGLSSLAGGADFAVTKFSVSCPTCP